MVFRRRWSHGAVQEERQHKATPRPRRLACALAWSPACLGSANHRSGSLSRCRKATLTNKVNRRQNQILLSRLRLVGCQLLPHVRLGNPELSRNPRWRDARRREQHLPDRASTKLWRGPLFLDERDLAADDRSSPSWLNAETMAFQQSTAVFLAVLPHRMSLQMARLVLCHSDVRRRYANSWAGYAVAVRFRASPSGYLVLVAAVKHLGPCRSGTARASTAQRAGVPCRNHAAIDVGRQYHGNRNHFACMRFR